MQAYTWNAIFLPKGAPAAIVKKLNDADGRGDEDAGRAGPPARPRRHDRRGRPRTPEYLGKFVKSEIEKWAAPIKASGVSRVTDAIAAARAQEGV